MILSAARPRPVTPVADEAVVVGLAMATVAATTWAIMAGNWADGTGVVLVTAVVAVLEAALIARASVSRRLGVVAAPVLGVVVIVFLTIGSMPHDGGTGLGNVAGRFARALTTGLYDSADWPFDVGLCAVMWLIGYWVGWLVTRERRGILALVPCYTALAVNALNAPSLSNVGPAETIAAGLSLLLIARVHLARLAQGWRVQRVIALPGTERRFASVSVMAAAGVLLLGVLAPPFNSRDVSGFLTGFSDLFNGKGLGSGDGSGGGAAPGRIAFSATVDAGGALLSDPQPVFSYTTSSGAPVYLRVLNDTVFSHGSWAPGTGTTRSSPAGPLPRAADGLPAATTRRSVQASLVLSGHATGAQDDALFAGEPLSVDNVAVTSLGLADPSGALRTVDASTLAAAAGRIDTTAVQSVATATQLRAAGTGYPAWIPLDWSRLTVGSQAEATQVAQIAQLARLWTAGTTNPYDAATAIENRLRSNEFAYTLTPPATPAGEWPIVFFLSQSRQGYCQYFASSMGAMLRAVGIPTRLVSGYGPGVSDNSRGGGPSALTYDVTTSDAHVWVEAFFPGYGWIPFEPTPPSADGIYQPFVRGGQATTAPSVNPGPTKPQDTAPTPNPATAPAGTAGGGGGVPPMPLEVAATGVIAALVLAGLLWAWLRRPRGLRGAWSRVGVLAWAFGVRRHPSETQSAFAGRLARALPEAGDALTVVAAAAGKDGFSRDGLDADDVIRWRAAWTGLCGLLPGMAWRRLRRRAT